MQPSLTHDAELLAEALDRLEGEFAGLPGFEAEVPGEAGWQRCWPKRRSA